MVRARVTSDELGDATAPPGSRPWAIHVKDEIYRHLQDGQAEVKGAQSYLRAIRESGGWRHLRGENGEKFASFDAFCQDRYPFGTGIDPELAISIIEADPNEILGQVRAKASERTQAAAQKTNGDVLPHGGDRIARPNFGLARKKRAAQAGISHETQRKQDELARLRPDLLEAIRAGRMKTDSAYREAMGKEKTKPFDTIVKLLPRLTPTEKRKLKELLE